MLSFVSWFCRPVDFLCSELFPDHRRVGSLPTSQWLFFFSFAFFFLGFQKSGNKGKSLDLRSSLVVLHFAWLFVWCMQGLVQNPLLSSCLLDVYLFDRFSQDRPLLLAQNWQWAGGWWFAELCLGMPDGMVTSTLSSPLSVMLRSVGVHRPRWWLCFKILAFSVTFNSCSVSRSRSDYYANTCTFFMSMDVSLLIIRFGHYRRRYNYCSLVGWRLGSGKGDGCGSWFSAIGSRS